MQARYDATKKQFDGLQSSINGDEEEDAMMQLAFIMGECSLMAAHIDGKRVERALKMGKGDEPQ